MSGNDTLRAQQKSGSKILCMELAVPAFSFGGALLAIFFSDMGNNVDPRYFATGCVISSFVLAYLAWIRPRKDIVALSTPIYSIIFFAAPSDMAVNIVLELLYAVSLTVLLVRLKFRFGAAPESGVADLGKSLEEPIGEYCETVREQVPGVIPETAHYAAMAFALFAQGDYMEVVRAADAASAALTDADPLPAIATAFAILREQALLLEESEGLPEHFTEFSATDAGLLAKPLPPEEKLHDRFEVSLENALLLLYAAGWNASKRDRALLLSRQSFALKLFTT
ncbi:hypothetical protein [uncultured Methanoregula sp.]|uniref:hypothetical protein n=1 Tax=uncultured Methanoregula sp. TaxID=1005933 RepID=UPI002AAB8BFB|nr:hypothetical protein [uncultured Methanoregula sp.]